MADLMKAAIKASQKDVITAAEHKLGRKLSKSERSGIQNIGSLMMLESCFRTFSSTNDNVAQVEADLKFFAQ